MKTCKSRSSAQFKALNEKETIKFLLRKLQDKEAELCYVKSVTANGGRLQTGEDGIEAPWLRQSVACQTDAPVELSPLPVPSIRRSTAFNGGLKIIPVRDQVGRRKSFYSAVSDSRQDELHPYGLKLKSFGSFANAKLLKAKDRYRRSTSSPATCASDSVNAPDYKAEWRDSLEIDKVREKLDELVDKQEDMVQNQVSEVEGIQNELIELLELHDTNDIDPSQHELEKIEFIQHEVDYKTNVAMFLEEGLQQLIDVTHSLNSLLLTDQYSDYGTQESV